MPTYRAKHRLARSEPHPDLESGNSVPWQRKYTAVCGYVGYSRDDFIGEHRGVTCLRCQKKMQSNTGLQPTYRRARGVLKDRGIDPVEDIRKLRGG
jgi:hypothetical protein